jgi:Tol biopolymer transport system component
MSNDGNKVAYADASGNLEVYDTVTKKSTQLAAAKQGTEENVTEYISYGDPVISPDGKYVVASTYYWEGSGTRIFGIDGKNFGDAPCVAGSTVWFPDSSSFVTASHVDNFGGGDGCVYLAKPTDPAKGKNLLTGSANKKSAFTPALSPDGKKVAFGYAYLEDIESQRDDLFNYRGIYVVNTDGTGLAQVTSNQSFSTAPVWQDNDTILYGLSNLYSKKLKGIYSIKADGSANTLLYSGDYSNYDAVYFNQDTGRFIFTTDNNDGSSAKDYTKKVYSLDLASKKATLIDTLQVTAFK